MVQIEEGKYYKNRCGDLIGPISAYRHDKYDKYRWIDSEGKIYTDQGFYWGKETIDRFDLVEEVNLDNWKWVEVEPVTLDYPMKQEATVTKIDEEFLVNVKNKNNWQAILDYCNDSVSCMLENGEIKAAIEYAVLHDYIKNFIDNEEFPPSSSFVEEFLNTMKRFEASL